MDSPRTEDANLGDYLRRVAAEMRRDPTPTETLVLLLAWRELEKEIAGQTEIEGTA
jgi:hypothetical protein